MSIAKIGFLDNFWYNAPFLDGHQIVTYGITNANNDITSIANESSSLLLGFLNVILTQEQVMVKERVHRNALAGTFLLIGAFISMITRITNLMLG